MKQTLLLEINRMREIMKLPLLMEGIGDDAAALKKLATGEFASLSGVEKQIINDLIDSSNDLQRAGFKSVDDLISMGKGAALKLISDNLSSFKTAASTSVKNLLADGLEKNADGMMRLDGWNDVISKIQVKGYGSVLAIVDNLGDPATIKAASPTLLKQLELGLGKLKLDNTIKASAEALNLIDNMIDDLSSATKSISDIDELASTLKTTVDDFKSETIDTFVEKIKEPFESGGKNYDYTQQFSGIQRIFSKLGIPFNSVDGYIKDLYTKLGAKNMEDFDNLLTDAFTQEFDKMKQKVLTKQGEEGVEKLNALEKMISKIPIVGKVYTSYKGFIIKILVFMLITGTLVWIDEGLDYNVLDSLYFWADAFINLDEFETRTSTYPYCLAYIPGYWSIPDDDLPQLNFILPDCSRVSNPDVTKSITNIEHKVSIPTGVVLKMGDQDVSWTGPIFVLTINGKQYNGLSGKGIFDNEGNKIEASTTTTPNNDDNPNKIINSTFTPPKVSNSHDGFLDWAIALKKAGITGKVSWNEVDNTGKVNDIVQPYNTTDGTFEYKEK